MPSEETVLIEETMLNKNPPLFMGVNQRTVHVDKTPDEIMDAAADVIDARGWTTGVFYASTGKVCTLGAMRLTIFPQDMVELSNDYCPELSTAMQFLRPPVEECSVHYWNDLHCKSGYEAADFLRSEAKRYREENS